MAVCRRIAVSLCAAAALSACQSDRSLAPNSMLLGAPDGASRESNAPSPYSVSESDIQVVAGQSHQLVASKNANGKQVPDSSVTWASENALIATVSSTGLVTGVTPGVTTVTASRGAHVVSISVTVLAACAISPIPAGDVTGALTADDCLFQITPTVSGHAHFYETLDVPNGATMLVTPTVAPGIGTGVAAMAADPRDGTVYGATSGAGMYRVIGNGDPLRLFAFGLSPAVTGSYSIAHRVVPLPYICGFNSFVVPGATFTGSIDPQTACHVNVAFTDYPPAMGQPLLDNRFSLRLFQDPGPHTVTVSNFSPGFNPALLVFFNGEPVAFSSPSGGATPTSRTVTFTPTTPGYYVIEVASGHFDGSGNWVIPTGSYTLSVTR